MTNRPQKSTATKRHRPRGSVPARRTELALDWQPARAALTGLFAELKSLSERSGTALGEAYARAASSLLIKQERLEDLSAERRYRQRRQSGASMAAPGVTSTSEEVVSTRKASI